jgi:hypothetical protein
MTDGNLVPRRRQVVNKRSGLLSGVCVSCRVEYKRDGAVVERVLACLELPDFCESSARRSPRPSASTACLLIQPDLCFALLRFLPSSPRSLALSLSLSLPPSLSILCLVCTKSFPPRNRTIPATRFLRRRSLCPRRPL